MWNSAIFGAKLLKSCKLLNLSYASGDDDDGSRVFVTKGGFSIFTLSQIFHHFCYALLCRDSGDTYFKACGSLINKKCLFQFECQSYKTPNLHLKLKMICMHTVR